MCHKKPVSPMMGDRETNILQQELYTKLSDLMPEMSGNAAKIQIVQSLSSTMLVFMSFMVTNILWGGFYGLVWVKAMLNSQVKLIEALRKSSNIFDYTFFFYLEFICFFGLFGVF